MFRNYVDNANGKTHFMLGYVSLPSEWFCLHNWKSEAADFHPPSEILYGLDIYWVDKGHKRTQPTSQNNVKCECKYQNKKLVWSHRPPRSLWLGREKLPPLYFMPSSSLQSSHYCNKLYKTSQLATIVKTFCSLVSTVSPGIPHYQHEKEGAFKFHSIQQKLLSCFPTVRWRLEKRGFRCSSYYKF